MLHGAMAAFQRRMDILQRDKEGFAAAFINDVIIYSVTQEEYLRTFGLPEYCGHRTYNPATCNMEKCLLPRVCPRMSNGTPINNSQTGLQKSVNYFQLNYFNHLVMCPAIRRNDTLQMICFKFNFVLKTKHRDHFKKLFVIHDDASSEIGMVLLKSVHYINCKLFSRKN